MPVLVSQTKKRILIFLPPKENHHKKKLKKKINHQFEATSPTNQVLHHFPGVTLSCLREAKRKAAAAPGMPQGPAAVPSPAIIR